MEEMNTLDPVSEWSHPAWKRLLSRYGAATTLQVHECRLLDVCELN